VKTYFILQLKMINRRCKDAGLEPAFAYPLCIIGFIALSFYLFSKTSYAVYFYPLASITLTSRLSEKGRNEFLNICFPNAIYRKIRLIENLLASFPFFLFLIYQQQYIISFILLLVSALLSMRNFRSSFILVLPTPFSRHPFEFTVGFRNSFYMIAIAYLLTCIAIVVNNFNLGIFSMLLLFAIMLSFYTKPEDEYYVWSHRLSATQFLLHKIKVAASYAIILIIPVVVALGIFFYHKLDMIFMFLLCGYAFLVCIIVAKYAAYPGEISLMQGFLIAAGLYFPPVLMLLIPYFFSRSVTRLKPLL